MIKYWNIFQKNLVSSLILTGTVYLAGLVLYLVAIYGIIGGLHNTPIFPFASLISLLTAALIWIVTAPLALRRNFTLAVSMSTTRKFYILTELFQTVLCSLILYAVCYLLFRLEKGVLIPLFYPDFPRLELPFFTTLFGSFSSGVFWALAFAGIALGIRLFLGSLLIRFGQILYWFLWGAWMCVCLLMSSLDSTTLASIEQSINHAGRLLNGCLIPLLCCTAGIVISCIGILLLKKQDVRSI